MIKLLLSACCCLSMLALPSVASDIKWRTLDPANTLLLQLETGNVVIELNRLFAPNHVAQIKTLARRGFYKNLDFYRVIDGFVAQGGVGEDENNTPTLKLEAYKTLNSLDNFIVVDNNDMFAPQTGFINDFASGYNPKTKQAWLLHCPGVLAMARDNSPDSGNTEIYITIGQAPRYLDQIMTIFGRVVYGMEYVQKLNRSQKIAGEQGVDRENYSKIINLQVMADVNKEKQIVIQVEDTSSELFREKISARRDRDHAFFFQKPPAVLDVCQFPLTSRVVTNTTNLTKQ